jgi:hypothetical protein
VSYHHMTAPLRHFSTASPALRDVDLQRSAENELHWLFEDGTTDIRVSVCQGWATLLGRVQYDSQISAAEAAIHGIRAHSCPIGRATMSAVLEGH